MTDEHEWVRRLLADAGSDPEPMPPHVAHRLDAALAGLEQPADREPAGDGDRDSDIDSDHAVVPMTRRRHRRWGAGLLAAAAITVGGYSLTATGVLDPGAGSAESAAGGDAAASDDGRDKGGREAAGGTSAEGADQAGDSAVTATGAPAWSSQTLRRDATELVRGPRMALRDEGAAAAPEGPPSELSAAPGRDCLPPPPVVEGTRHPVTYDGEPATAVVRERAAGTSVVEVWSCAAPTRLGRVVVPGGR